MAKAVRSKTITEQGRDLLLRQSARQSLPSEGEQLALWNAFADATPQKYTHTLELFDAIPKFTLGASTSLRAKGSLAIVKRDFEWNGCRYRITIRPTVLETKDPSGEFLRKEMLPGSREEAVYRVLRKMASDPTVERRLRGKTEVAVVMKFSMSHLRSRLAAVGYGMKSSELKESLQILTLTPLVLTNLDTGREIFSSNNYFSIDYVTDANDETGERTVVEVAFNRLAALAIINGLTDLVNYERLMNLHDPVAQWIYEKMTQNFRQAGVDYGYKITLQKLLNESPMRPGVLRQNLARVKKSLQRLVEFGVLRGFPEPYTENYIFGASTERGGRRRIVDVQWELFPSNDVVSDIKSDNSRKATLRLKSPSR
jgi:hypothetical protein